MPLEWFQSLDWELELMFAARALLATVLGALIGLERERHQKYKTELLSQIRCIMTPVT